MKKGRKKIMIVFLIFLLFIILTVVYSMTLGVRGLKVKEYKVINQNLPHSFYGLKILHFSDLHYGRTVHEKELENLVNTINLTKPDIVVFTGDLIDKDIILKNTDVKIIEEKLKKITSTYGNYYVKGNHDLYFKNFELIMENSNFINLNNNFDLITNNLNENIFIGGIYTEQDIIPDTEKIKEHLSINNYTYKILLLHMPDYIEYVDDNFDLILAGHSHNGQVRLPFIGALAKAEGAKKYNKEHYKINDTDLFISSGIGTSTFNTRLFNKPSINLYRIVNK